MTIPVHVAAGGLASLFPGPVAFIFAFLSHPLLDKYGSEYKPNWADKKVIVKYLPWAVWWLVITAAPFLYGVNRLIICIVIAVLPDVIEAIHILYGLLLGKNYWITGDHIFPWHKAKSSREQISFISTFLVEVVSATTVILIIKFGG